MLKNLVFIFICLIGQGAGMVYGQSGSNDHIFPPAPAAKPFIDFDSKGFLVDGRRCFLVSAGMEYARVPHDLWYDRLLRLKRAGFNCIEIYTFWNFHEPQEGRFDFSGDHDLGAFLRLVGRLGLYAIVRVGPYYCAEWDNGGYPLWLRFKPGVRVREDNAEFEKYVDRFFDRLFPIVCGQQINHGGPVVLVQLENEHPKGWGTYMPDGYFRHLREKALSLGLEVPYFFSGLHHASDPASNDAEEVTTGPAGSRTLDVMRLDDSTRPNPWMSTEFWSVWYSGYGSTDKDARVYERRTWKIIAHGGNGYNYYMAYGGSNFGYTNNDEDAASYDYGAAVGQSGDLRPIYYTFKRAAWFARSFRDILENSTDATGMYAGLVQDTALRVTARHSPAGDLIFLDNPSSVPVRVALAAGAGGAALPAGMVSGAAVGAAGSGRADVVLAPGEIFPVVHHFALTDRVILEWAMVRILGISGEGNVRTMVVYGDSGSSAALHFIVGGGRHVDVHAKFSDARVPAEYTFKAGNMTVRILAVSRALADRTWFLEKGGRSYIASGPAYIGDITFSNNHISLVTETPSQEGRVRDFPVLLYGGAEKPVVLKDNGHVVMGEREEGRGARGVTGGGGEGWQERTAGEPAASGFDDREWKFSEWPQQMGADGDGSPDAWYRTTIRPDTSGAYILQVEGGDRASVFIDGNFVHSGNIHEGEIPLTLSKGKHELAVFTAHDGRDKLAGFLGSMETADSKGLTGHPRLEKGVPSRHELGDWHFLRASGPLSPGQVVLPTGKEEGWTSYLIGQDAFDHRQGFGWFRALLPEPPVGITKGVLSFTSVDENATVFLNGRQLARHEGWNQPFEISLDRLDTLQRPLVLTLFIENYTNEGGVDRPVRVKYIKDAQDITGWCMRGGIAEPQAITGWKMLQVASGGRDTTVSGPPCYYRTKFKIPVYGVTGDHPIWRVQTTGLGHGSVWVNGHNLGRYPEKTAAPGLYIPECWLKAGSNELVIYEEDGHRPDRVSVQQEAAAGRVLSVNSNF